MDEVEQLSKTVRLRSVRYVSIGDQTLLSTQMRAIRCVTTVDRSMTTEKSILVHVWGNASTVESRGSTLKVNCENVRG